MQTLNQQILERGAAYFNLPAVLARLDEQTRKDIEEGRKEFIMSDFYVRKRLDGFAGEVEIIRNTDDQQVGVTRFEKGKLPQGTYVAVVAIGAAYAYDSTSLLAEDQVRYCTSEYLDTFPTKLLSSDLILKNGDKTIYEGRLKNFLANAFADYGSAMNDENIVLLPSPKLLDFRQLTKANLKFSTRGAAPAAYHFVEITFKGVAIVPKA